MGIISKNRPIHGSPSFICPTCNALAQMRWIEVTEEAGGASSYPFRGYTTAVAGVDERELTLSECHACKARAIWLAATLVHPRVNTAPPPTESMPTNVAELYREAASIWIESPRGAGALLRHALELLLIGEGFKAKQIDGKIVELRASGRVPAHAIEAADVTRVIGNNCAHPLEIDINESPDRVTALFGLLNNLVDHLIASPARSRAAFATLPDGAKKAVEKRDAPKSSGAPG